ncbi:SAM-dependent methyltransferase [Microbacterium resistens]|uniref:SAM-dependent methyltransferase n=1 Tax=Microbacterium resistens TaxID=156977 RepID=A0ABU1SDI5_9MICO|nr:daptide-type RiPP biosynthesis methyltransferase [Microbacterium resistens]MDR6866962.1 SAM-dependent methyltransferase [Microbacterium resistens]
MSRNDQVHRGRAPASPPAVLAALLTAGSPSDDLYSTEGSRLYERLAEFDVSEQTALLRLLAGTDGDILELACGGGRLAFPLLSLGRPVTGLDLSPEMIRALEERYRALPASRRTVPLTGVVGDMRDFVLGGVFGAIVLGTTSMLLLDEEGRRRLYASVRRHLAPGGRFFVSVPGKAMAPGSTSTRVVPLRGETPSVAIVSDHVRVGGRTRDVSILHLSRPEGGDLVTREFSSTVFLLTAGELDRELAEAGFTLADTVIADTVAAGTATAGTVAADTATAGGGAEGGLLVRGYTA